jgi:hypothetical protein
MAVQKSFGIVADIHDYVQVTKDIKYDVFESVQSTKHGCKWSMHVNKLDGKNIC